MQQAPNFNFVSNFPTIETKSNLLLLQNDIISYFVNTKKAAFSLRSWKLMFWEKSIPLLISLANFSFSRKNFPRKISENKFSEGFLGKIEKSSRKSENPARSRSLITQKRLVGEKTYESKSCLSRRCTSN